MRRLVLILGLVVLGWLGRRQLRSAAHAQRYLTLLALLQIVAVMGKTSASAKAVSTENRLNTAVIPALGTLNSSVSSLSSTVGSLPAFITSLTQQFSPGGFGGPASSSPTDMFNWANLATARFNQIYTIMQNTHLWL